MEKRLDLLREDVNLLMRAAALLIARVEALEALTGSPPPDPPQPPEPRRRGRIIRLPPESRQAARRPFHGAPGGLF